MVHLSWALISGRKWVACLVDGMGTRTCVLRAHGDRARSSRWARTAQHFRLTAVLSIAELLVGTATPSTRY